MFRYYFVGLLSMAGVAWVLDDRFERPVYFPDLRQEMESMRLSDVASRQLRAFQGLDPVSIFCRDGIDETVCQHLSVHSVGRGTSSSDYYRYQWKGGLACAELRRALAPLSAADPTHLQSHSSDEFNDYVSRLDVNLRQDAEHRFRLRTADRSYERGTKEYAALKDLLGRVANVKIDCDRTPVRIEIEVRRTDLGAKKPATSAR